MYFNLVKRAWLHKLVAFFVRKEAWSLDMPKGPNQASMDSMAAAFNK